MENKTPEEKLAKLFQIAAENGCSYDPTFLDISDKDSWYELSTKECVIYDSFYDPWMKYSINDIVLNWEEGDVSFFEALCKATKTILSYSDYQQWSSSIITNMNIDFKHEELEFLWNFEVELKNDGIHKIIKRPTFKKLEWLFETFKHLLNEE